MTIKSISRSEFDRLLPRYQVLESLMAEPVQWFSNRSGSLLAAVAKGESEAGWSYAILKRDKEGGFHVRKVMNNFFSLNVARTDLMLSMKSMGSDRLDQATAATSLAALRY